jgi:putative salt-induced outer membrane protein YdiY
MRKRKWLIPVVLASVLVIGGIAGGVIAAADNGSSNNTDEQSQAASRFEALLDRVCAIYEEKTGVAIDSEQLREALKQARNEMQDEALKEWLQRLVEKGKITQEQADQYLEWWQSRPDIGLPLPGLGGHGLGRGMVRGGGFGRWGGPWCGSDTSGEAGD